MVILKTTLILGELKKDTSLVLSIPRKTHDLPFNNAIQI
jgi:hypothetical protein